MKTSLTPVVLGIIIVNVVIHLVSLTMYDKIEPIRDKYQVLWKEGSAFGLRSSSPPGEFNFVQPLGSAFAHSIAENKAGQVLFQGSIAHILLNMMCLVFLGPAVEKRMGSKVFLLFYLFAAIVGGLITAFVDPALNPVVGASGAISGLLVALAWLFPQSRLGLFLIPIYLPARIFAAGFAAFSLIAVIIEATTGKGILNISHFGHFAGMIAGFIFMVGYQLLSKPKLKADPTGFGG